MLNFILEKDKNKIIKEYYYRVAIYFLLFSFFTLVVLISLFLPSIFYSKYKSDTVSQQLMSIKSSIGNNTEDPIEIIKEVNKFVNVFKYEESVLFSDIIKKIVSLKYKDIEILSISLLENEDDTVKIVLNGISATRDSLTSYDRDLKKDGFFQSVELPVTDLIKNIDSNFTITLTYKKQDAKK